MEEGVYVLYNELANQQVRQRSKYLVMLSLSLSFSLSSPSQFVVGLSGFYSIITDDGSGYSNTIKLHI